MKLLQASDICRGVLGDDHGRHCANGWILAYYGFYACSSWPHEAMTKEVAKAPVILAAQERIGECPYVRTEFRSDEDYASAVVAHWNNDESNPPGKIAAALNQLFATLDGPVQQDVIEPAKRELVTA